MRLVCALISAAMMCSGCGPADPVVESAAPRSGRAEAIKLRHQILARYGDQEQVFEGYLVLRGDALFVRAFAGPGIDLFTIRRNGARHEERAHVPGLEGRVDLEKVGADIARCHYGGCQGGSGETRCDFYGEPLIETRDERGRLVERNFPRAHGIGLIVRYQEPRLVGGREVARRTTLSWGDGSNELVIVTLDSELLERVEPGLLDVGQ
ncbi:MAG: hypothetical protein R6V85_09910 [Polyangia bacterium]